MYDVSRSSRRRAESSPSPTRRTAASASPLRRATVPSQMWASAQVHSTSAPAASACTIASSNHVCAAGRSPLCPEWVLARYPRLCEGNEPNTPKNRKNDDNNDKDDKKDR